MESSINKKLKELYLSKWDNLSIKLNAIINSDDYLIKPTNPLILSHKHPEEFETSDVKVMILGQENNDWGDVFKNDYEDMLQICADFYEGEYYQHFGHFHNHFNILVDLLKEKFKNNKIGLFWSNVIRIGKANDKGLPPNYILNIIEEEFNVFQDELKIIQPNIIIFLSGPNYDQFIDKQIKGLKIESVKDFSYREFAKMEIPNVQFAFRTYHPQKMNYLGKVHYLKIYNTIMNNINI